MNPNQTILDEVNSASSWFHAKKVKPIWAKVATADGALETLEATESYQKGDFICRGEAGDEWPQSPESLNKKYDATDDVNDDGWRKYVLKPEATGVMAAQINHTFEVKARWGDLKGKPGDFLVKNIDEKQTEYPVDVWIVDREIFESTYQAADAKK